jgi:fatty acid desaturase
MGPNAFTSSPYVLYVLLPAILVGAAVVAIAAAFQGSKWWLLALMGPVSGGLLLLTASI